MQGVTGPACETQHMLSFQQGKPQNQMLTAQTKSVKLINSNILSYQA